MRILLGSEANPTDIRATVERLAAATGALVFAEFEAAGLLIGLPDRLFGGLVQGLYSLGEAAPDVVLMAGLRFGLYTAVGSGNLVSHAARVVQIDPDAREIPRLHLWSWASSPRRRVDGGSCGDIRGH